MLFWYLLLITLLFSALPGKPLVLSLFFCVAVVLNNPNIGKSDLGGFGINKPALCTASLVCSSPGFSKENSPMTQKHPWQANKSNSCGSLYFKLQHTRQTRRFQNWISFARFRHHHEMYITDSLVMLLVLHTIIFVTCELRPLMTLTVFQDWVRWCISNAKSRTLELIALKGPTQLLLSQVSESFA